MVKYCSSPDYLIWAIPMYLQRKMFHLPVALNPMELVVEDLSTAVHLSLHAKFELSRTIWAIPM